MLHKKSDNEQLYKEVKLDFYYIKIEFLLYYNASDVLNAINEE